MSARLGSVCTPLAQACCRHRPGTVPSWYVCPADPKSAPERRVVWGWQHLALTLSVGVTAWETRVVSLQGTWWA